MKACHFGDAAAKATFAPAMASGVETIGVVGAGDVVKNRVARALAEDDFRHMRVAFCSREEASPIDTLPHQYYSTLPNNLLPLDKLDRDGFLGPRVLWIIATPSDSHVPYALQLAPLCGRVAIEKPLASDGAQAHVLLPLARAGCRILPIDHKLFTRQSIAFLDHCRANPGFLSGVRSIEGVYLESRGFAPGRVQENVLKDVQWHLLMLMIATLKGAGTNFEVIVESASAARHRASEAAGLARADVPTASRLQGTVQGRGIDLTFDFLQAKAANQERRYIRLLSAGGSILSEVDLGESGWQAHGRLIRSLTSHSPDMHHDLGDAIAVADLIADVSAQILEGDMYDHGELPDFFGAATTI